MPSKYIALSLVLPFYLLTHETDAATNSVVS